jgi:hypothetical protein
MLSLRYLTEGARNITTNTWHTKLASLMSRNNYHSSCIDLNLISPMCMKLESLPICSKCLTIKSDWCILLPCLLVFMASTSKIGQILPFLIRWTDFGKRTTYCKPQELPNNSCIHKSSSHADCYFVLFIFILCSALFMCVCVCERLLSIKSLGLASGIETCITFWDYQM